MLKTLQYLCSKSQGIGKHRVYNYTCHHRRCKNPQWDRGIKKLLGIYDLPSTYTLLENTPKKRQWKKTLNEAVWSHWQKELKDEFPNTDACQTGKLHPLWRNTTSQLDILKATVKAQLLVKRYPLSTSRTAGKKWSNICKLCETEPETMAHFLLW